MLAEEIATSEEEASGSSRTSWLILALIAAAVVAIAILLGRPTSTSADFAVTEHHFAGGKLKWEIVDYPAAVLAKNTFLITLTNESGQPLKGGDLTVKLEMIDMICGDYDFRLTEVEPGVYTGEGIPLMAGLWKATLTINGNKDATISRTLKAVYR